jgi:hypothetical protein
MDPVTAVADMVKAFVEYSTAVFKASSPENQAKVADAHATILLNMLDFAIRAQERFEKFGDGIDKVINRRKGKDAEPDAKGNV